MLLLSELISPANNLESFEELVELIGEVKKGKRFFRMDVKPPYSDTPDNWEDRLEAAFN